MISGRQLLGPALVAAALVASIPAAAAPEAHLLRIDPGVAPVVTTLIDLVQGRPIADVTRSCAGLSGDAGFDCVADAIEQPGALFASFGFPQKNVMLTITTGGADVPATFDSQARWRDSAGQPGVGTAWLVLVDASSSMGARFDDAKEIAAAFVDAMGPGDVADVMLFNDRAVVMDSHWIASKAQAAATLAAIPGAYPPASRPRSLFDVIKSATTDGFKDLQAAKLSVPLHQAMVVVSNGVAPGDSMANAAGGTVLHSYFSKGLFPDGGAPKRPLPVVSVWLPDPQEKRLSPASREFMEGMATPELGGFFTIVRAGRKSRGPIIAGDVRARFDKMHLVRWRVPCGEVGKTQSFKLLFVNTTPPIAGDATFKDAAMGGIAPCRAP